MKTPTTLITFTRVPMRPHQIPELRAMLNDCLDWQDDRLHNHTPEGGELYRYPLVQYRCHEGRAAVFGIGEGCGLLHKLTQSSLLPAEFRAEMTTQNKETDVRLAEQTMAYCINHFLPLNSENYQQWKQEPGLIDRTRLVERVLTGHLLDFCTAVGYQVPDRGLRVTLKKMDTRKSVPLPTNGQNMKFLCFDLTFEANLYLPDLLGLGKGKSKGYGVVHRIEAPRTQSKQRVLLDSRINPGR
ncbi:MAG: hypothetical protein KKG00_06190 [Bacteroidetes bacterium]|nr:hypothetical protein [Bacteroidota bacterium]